MFVVAGASGRTGRVVAEILMSQGKQVRLLTRHPERVEPLRRRGAEVVIASLDDGAALQKALEGADAFYTLIPENPLAADFHGERRRVVEALTAAVRGSRVPHVVLLSAAAAALPDGNGPGRELHLAENSLRETGAVISAIRAAYFQENVLAAVVPAKTDRVYPSLFPADMKFPTVATRDVGALAARCLLEPPRESEIIDFIGPMYSVRDFAEKLGAVLDSTLRVVEIPTAAQVDALTQFGMSRSFAEVVAEMCACFAAGRVKPGGHRVLAGTTTLEQILPGLVQG